ncbi:MBL fold metallo-hydrolase [Hydrogenophaga sp. UC242_50]|uniref:MBL fold metallo-hydrolase n=1 Tax=Hydrogenophaga sp. UC242_50 TaxID=3350169 RepID=UPI0036D2E099
MSVDRTYFEDGRIELTHYGSAAWKITDGKHTVLLDPYFTRLRYSGNRFGMLPANAAPGDERPAYSFDEIVPSDAETIDRHIHEATHILLSHAHFNHCMDMPHIAKKTGAHVVGSYSATNIARAYGVAEPQLVPVRGGEDYDFGELSIRVIPSLHSALCDKCYFDAGIVPEGLQGPLPLKAFSEGGTFGYLVRFRHHEILMFGSMNYIEREVQGLTPSIVLVPSARPRLQIFRYTERLLRATGLPKVVVRSALGRADLPLRRGPEQRAGARRDLPERGAPGGTRGGAGAAPAFRDLLGAAGRPGGPALTVSR